MSGGSHEDRFATLTTVGEARRYLQAEFARRRQHPFHHPGDKDCTIEHWRDLLLAVRRWFPDPVPLP